MEIETYYLSVLSDTQTIIQNLTDIVGLLQTQVNSLYFVCVVLLLKCALDYCFFNRRV